MLLDYLELGEDEEIINLTRLQAYLDNVGSPFTTGAALCSCDTLTAAMLGQNTPYNTPATDPAPWYDPAVPESALFLGLLPLSVTGLDDDTGVRSVVNAVGGGGSLGPRRKLPRVITITALVVAASCCAAEYGLFWLSQTLQGCCGGSGCDGDTLRMYNCCPDATMTRQQWIDNHRRTLRRVALTSGPTVISRDGSGTCARGTCGANGDQIVVEFTLTAASPDWWTEQRPAIDAALPVGGTGACIKWCLPTDVSPACQGPCAFAPCVSVSTCGTDPRCAAPEPPEVTGPEPCFCVPLAFERSCFTLDLSARPGWSDDVPTITITAGSTDLRGVRVSIFERVPGSTETCDSVADNNACHPVFQAYVTYVPANGVLTIDGQTGRSLVRCSGACNPATTVFGTSDGGPLTITPLSCANYCLCVEVSQQETTSVGSSISVTLSGRGY
jgi:hypothetical protein